MYIILWKYRIKKEKQAEFEEIYSPNGKWAELFKKTTNYLGTELLQDEAQPDLYFTIDRWRSKEDFIAFQTQFEDEYHALDRECEGLTESEIFIGRGEATF